MFLQQTFLLGAMNVLYVKNFILNLQMTNLCHFVAKISAMSWIKFAVFLHTMIVTSMTLCSILETGHGSFLDFDVF